jgi:hypothetical protein
VKRLVRMWHVKFNVSGVPHAMSFVGLASEECAIRMKLGQMFPGLCNLEMWRV